jgi:hypothetical protein
VSKAECRLSGAEETTHGRVGRNIRLDCGTGSLFARVSEVKLIDSGWRQRREEVGVEGVNFGWALDAVR